MPRRIYRIKGKRVSKKQYMEQMKAIHTNNYQPRPKRNKMSSKTKMNPQRKIEYKSTKKTTKTVKMSLKEIKTQYLKNDKEYIKKVSQNLPDWKDRRALLFDHADQLNKQYETLSKLESNPNLSSGDKREISKLKNMINTELTEDFATQLSKDKGRARDYKRKNKEIPEIDPPNGTKINPDGSIELEQDLAMNYEGDNGLKGEYRKSFVELTRGDKGREYSATYDFEDNIFSEEKVLQDIDIRRGKSIKESKGGRASVTSRIDRNDEISVHNHPLQNEGSRTWNRPSGSDIANAIYLRFTGDYPKYQESYIIQPDGRFVRYKVDDLRKATDRYSKAQDEFAEYEFRNKHKPFGFKSGIDWVIEEKFSDIRDKEKHLSSQANFDSKKGSKIILDEFAKFEKKDKEYQRQIKDLEKKGIAKAKKNPKLKVHSTPEFVKLSKLDVKRRQIFDEYLKKEEEIRKIHPTRRNPKFLQKKKGETKEQWNNRWDTTIQRRSVTKWIKYMKSEWGVEVTRMPKNFKREF